MSKNTPEVQTERDNRTFWGVLALWFRSYVLSSPCPISPHCPLALVYKAQFRVSSRTGEVVLLNPRPRKAESARTATWTPPYSPEQIDGQLVSTGAQAVTCEETEGNRGEAGMFFLRNHISELQAQEKVLEEAEGENGGHHDTDVFCVICWEAETRLRGQWLSFGDSFPAEDHGMSRWNLKWSKRPD